MSSRPAKAVVPALSVTEQLDLQRLERTVADGLAATALAGAALAEIQSRKLYRDEYQTFEDYCRQRWKMGRATAYRLIETARVIADLTGSTMSQCETTCDTGGSKSAPAAAPAAPVRVTATPLPNAAQARELAQAPPAERAGVWAETVQRTAGRPTAAAVRSVMDEAIVRTLPAAGAAAPRAAPPPPPAPAPAPSRLAEAEAERAEQQRRWEKCEAERAAAENRQRLARMLRDLLKARRQALHIGAAAGHLLVEIERVIEMVRGTKL